MENLQRAILYGDRLGEELRLSVIRRRKKRNPQLDNGFAGLIEFESPGLTNRPTDLK